MSNIILVLIRNVYYHLVTKSLRVCIVRLMYNYVTLFYKLLGISEHRVLKCQVFFRFIIQSMFTVLYLPDNTTFHCITASTTIPATMYHQILDMHFYSNSYNNNIYFKIWDVLLNDTHLALRDIIKFYLIHNISRFS